MAATSDAVAAAAAAVVVVVAAAVVACLTRVSATRVLSPLLSGDGRPPPTTLAAADLVWLALSLELVTRTVASLRCGNGALAVFEICGAGSKTVAPCIA